MVATGAVWTPRGEPNYSESFERAMRVELTTYSMGSCHSTTELRPQRLAIVSERGQRRQARQRSLTLVPATAAIRA